MEVTMSGKAARALLADVIGTAVAEALARDEAEHEAVKRVEAALQFEALKSVKVVEPFGFDEPGSFTKWHLTVDLPWEGRMRINQDT